MEGSLKAVAAVYHYYFKSKEEFIAKRLRGNVFFGEGVVQRNLEQARNGLDVYGNPIPIGDIWDDSAWKAVKKLVPEYAVYEQNPLSLRTKRKC